MSTTISVIPYYEVIDSIHGYILKNSYTYFDWYIGLTDNAEKMLFEDHKLNQVSDMWIYEEVPSDSDAFRIREYFLNMGCAGGLIQNRKKVRYIYAYRRSSKTNPWSYSRNSLGMSPSAFKLFDNGYFIHFPIFPDCYICNI